MIFLISFTGRGQDLAERLARTVRAGLYIKKIDQIMEDFSHG